MAYGQYSKIFCVWLIYSLVHLVCKIGRGSLFLDSSRCWPLPNLISNHLDQLRHSQYQLHKLHSSFLKTFYFVRFMISWVDQVYIDKILHILDLPPLLEILYDYLLRLMFRMNWLNDVISCIFRLSWPNWGTSSNDFLVTFRLNKKKLRILKAIDECRNFHTLRNGKYQPRIIFHPRKLFVKAWRFTLNLSSG